MRRIFSGLTLALLLVSMLTLAFDIQPVKASGTIYIRADGSVDPDTAPISSVDNITYTFTGNINDFIVVERENIVVDGAGYTIQGTENETGIHVSGRSNITIRNMEIKMFLQGIYLGYSSNCTIYGNKITNNQYGIYLSSSSNNSIYGNNITSNKRGIRLESSSNDNSIYGNTVTTNTIHGIWLYESSNNTLFGNNITNSDYGVMIDRSDNNNLIGNTMINTLKIPFNPNAPYNCIDGIHLYESGNCKIIGNTITNCSWVGIQLGHFTENNIVKNNTITDIGFLAEFNGIGLILLDCQNSTFSGNTVTNCRTGIYIWRSNGNTLYHNSFINNPRQVGLAYEPSNKLDNGYPSGGNYWSDYNSTDFYSGAYQNITGSDGIGDIPYVINANNTDNYPLIHPYGSIRNLNTSLVYLTIQSAINAPETLDGHTIFVEAGTYYEHVIVNKTVSLIGGNKSTTTVNGNNTGNPITVTANNVTISGFTIQGSKRGTWSCHGIFLSDSDNHTIRNNIITQNGDGIRLQGSDNNLISNNDITLNGNGIFMIGSNANTIVSNVFTNNNDGIKLSKSVGNIVNGNIIGCNNDGIVLIYSNNNFVYHNDIVYNKNRQAHQSGQNSWDDGYPSGGNYWSDYTGIDVMSGPYQNETGSDGIGDTPYVISLENIQDNYPLIEPWNPLPKYTLTIYTSPTGATFTVDGVSRATPWSGTYGYCVNVSLVMPETHDGYVWSHWLEDGDPNRTKTITLPGTTWTGVFVFAVQPYGPTAEFTVTPETANVGESIEFDASASLPGWNGTHTMPITEYHWDFGDGNITTTSTPIICHRFSSSGNYYVTLTVYAPEATPETDSTTHRVTVVSVPVGGYSFPIEEKEKPLTLYLALVAILTVSFTMVKRKKHRKAKRF